MAELQIKEEYLPSRCEVCHQSDCFEPLTNYCSRCSNIQRPASAYVLPKQHLRYFFAVSNTKLILMSLCTFGLYKFYWFYKNWDIINDRSKKKVSPVGRSFFSIFFCHSLFTEIWQVARELNIKTRFNPELLALSYVLVTIARKMPSPFSIISYLSVFLLLPVQAVINQVHEQATPHLEMNNKYSAANIITIAIGGILFILALIGSLVPE